MTRSKETCRDTRVWGLSYSFAMLSDASPPAWDSHLINAVINCTHQAFRENRSGKVKGEPAGNLSGLESQCSGEEGTHFSNGKICSLFLAIKPLHVKSL